MAIKNYTQTFTIRGEDFEVVAPALFNQNDELIYDQKLDDQAIEIANNAYRSKHGFIFPKEIREFRGKLGISGRDLAALIGFSPTTIVMYENGALPTETNNRHLKNLIANEDTFKTFFESNKSKISASAKQKVQDYLDKNSIDIDPVSIIKIVDWFRVKNIILQRSNENIEDLTQMKVMKLVYYVQGLSFKWFGKPAFEEPILAWKYGPVVEEIHNLYSGCTTIVEDIKQEIPEETLSNFEDLNNDVSFSKILEFVQSRLGDYSAITLANKTHAETPWLTTNQSNIISNDKIKNYFDENFDSIFSN
ncbi:type II toxin-antitoxin system antitoxin SocA domain-containing protein [Lactococcus cremoris]